jgi:hypothetical protein
VLAVSSRDGIEAARTRIKEYLGWEEVRSQLKDQLKGHDLDPIRDATLSANISGSRAKISEQIQLAYCIVVTVSEKHDIQAFKINVNGGPLFTKIKEDKRSRIQDTAIESAALLPGGPYDLWRQGETSRRLNDLVGAFPLSPQLPKMLNRKAILDTLGLSRSGASSESSAASGRTTSRPGSLRAVSSGSWRQQVRTERSGRVTRKTNLPCLQPRSSARAIEVTVDSSQWPCDFAAAQNVKFKIPTTPSTKDEFLRPDVLVAEAELKPSEIQDLADNLAEIRKATGEAELRFRLKLSSMGAAKYRTRGSW